MRKKYEDADESVSKSESVLQSSRECGKTREDADDSVSSTATTHSFVQTFNSKTCDHLDGAFLEVEDNNLFLGGK